MAKGITPIIAIIILLLITVAIAGMGWSYINMYTGGLMAKQIEIVSSTCVNGQAKIIVKSIGTGPFDTSGVRLVDKNSGADITSAAQWSPGVAEAGKVLELNFNDQANPLKDLSGNGNNGVSYNGAYWVAAGRSGGAFRFDGVNDYVATSSLGNLGSNSFAFSLWVNPSGSVGSYDMPLYKGGSSAADKGFDFELGSDQWTTCISNGTTMSCVEISASPLNTVWSHILVNSDRTEGRRLIYLNGLLVSNVTLIGGNFITSQVLNLGSSGFSWPYNGLIDEVRVYNRALSAGEITALATNTVTIEPGGMATITHTCGGQRCNYQLVSFGSVREAYVGC